MSLLDRLTPKQKIWAVALAAAGCGALLAVTGLAALEVTRGIQEDLLEDHAQNLIEGERARTALERHLASEKAYLISHDERFIADAGASDRDLASHVERLRALVKDTTGKRLLGDVEREVAAYRASIDELVAGRGETAELGRLVVPRRDALDAALASFERYQQQRLDAGRELAARLHGYAREFFIQGTAIAILGIVLVVLGSARASVDAPAPSTRARVLATEAPRH